MPLGAGMDFGIEVEVILSAARILRLLAVQLRPHLTGAPSEDRPAHGVLWPLPGFGREQPGNRAQAERHLDLSHRLALRVNRNQRLGHGLKRFTDAAKIASV